MRTPFFIVGAARSGSTYLYYMLKEHPRVALTNEARLIDALSLGVEAMSLGMGERSPTTGMMGVLRPDLQGLGREVFLDHLPRIIESFYERLFDKEFTHYGDKIPDSYTAAVAAQIDPKVRVIYLVRDPRDVVCSFLNLQQKGREGYDLGPRQEELMATPLAEFARVWNENNKSLLDHLSDYHLVRYPDLIRQPRKTVSRIVDYLGLDMVPEVENAIATNDTIGGHGTSRTAGESLGRWRRDLSDPQVATILAICGTMMKRLGIPLGAASKSAPEAAMEEGA